MMTKKVSTILAKLSPLAGRQSNVLHAPRYERDLQNNVCRDYISAIAHTLWTQAFLGQKYGYRPFPPKIAADEFEAIRRELETVDGAWSLLDTWFRKDTNSVPHVYVLQPISSVLPHYTDMVCFLYVLFVKYSDIK